jgi:hypothetical protein
MFVLSRRSALLSVAAVLGVSAIAFSASAQNPQDPSQGPSGSTAEVSMVRQDQSDCTNSDVNGNDPSRIGGTAWVVRQPDGKTAVKVAITALPNTVYHFYLKCVRQLGDIKTQDEGEGIATFEFPTNTTGAIYAFDMYPEGAPPGNKFQSVQVKFQ